MVLAQELRDAVLQAAMQGKLTGHTNDDMKISENMPFEIPYEWKWMRLKEVCCSIVDGDHQPPPKSQSGIPFLVIGNVSSGKLSFESTRYVSYEYYRSLQDSRVPQKGDILFTVTGSYGIPVLVDTDKEFCFQRHMALLKTNSIHRHLLVYWLKSYCIKLQCDRVATGTAQKTVSIQSLRNFWIPIPPREEQQRIVERVNAIMEQIDEYEKIEQELVRLKADFPGDMKAAILQAAMQGKLTKQLSSDTPVESMLPKIQIEKQRIMRDKNIRNSNRKSSEIEYYDTIVDIPNEWIMCRLDDLCYVIPTKSYQVQEKEVLVEGTYPVVSQSVNLIDGYHNDANKLLKNDDVILVFGDHSKTLKYVDFDFIVGADGTKLIAPVGIHPKYLYYALMYNLVNMPDRGYARHFGMLKRMRIPFPPIEEQQRIVDKLDALLPLCENL